MIFYRKGVRGQTKKGDDILYDLDSKINFAVFPGLQVRPHQRTSNAAGLPAEPPWLGAATATFNVVTCLHRHICTTFPLPSL